MLLCTPRTVWTGHHFLQYSRSLTGKSALSLHSVGGLPTWRNAGLASIASERIYFFARRHVIALREHGILISRAHSPSWMCRGARQGIWSGQVAVSHKSPTLKASGGAAGGSRGLLGASVGPPLQRPMVVRIARTSIDPKSIRLSCCPSLRRC